MTNLDGELETGSYLDQRTPVQKKGGTAFDKDVEGFSVDSNAGFNNQNGEDDFKEFDENKSDDSDHAYIAGHVIYKKSQ